MNPDFDGTDSLRKLLALKRHEAPPPGYFHRFSGQVITRIEAGERATTAGGSWLSRWLGFDLKPALVCGFGVMITALLVGGVITAQNAVGPSSPVVGNRLLGGPEMRAATAYAPEDMPASTAPVLAQTSPFSSLVVKAERAKFNVMLISH